MNSFVESFSSSFDIEQPENRRKKSAWKFYTRKLKGFFFSVKPDKIFEFRGYNK